MSWYICFFASFFLLDSEELKEAGWNDPNIVLVNHKWVQIVEDPNDPDIVDDIENLSLEIAELTVRIKLLNRQIRNW